MKIQSIRGHAVSVPLTRQYSVATEPFTVASQIVVEVTTDDGLTGLGLIHGRAVKSVLENLRKLGEMLKGTSAFAHEAVWAKVFSLTNDGAKIYRDGDISGMGFRTGERAPVMAALAGIDFALWDLKGKACNVPVWRLLGADDPVVHAYASGGYYQHGRPLEIVADEMAGYVEQGFTAVKMKVGGATPAQDIDRVRRVRAAIGDGVDLMIDASRSYTLAQSMDAIKAYEPFNPFWFEEPLHWYDATRGMAKLTQHTNIPLCSGESESHLWACRDLVDLGLVRYMNFDGTRAGGATEWLRIANYCHAHGVLMATHHDPHVHGHLAAAVPNGYCVEAFVDNDRDPLWENLFSKRAQIVKGKLVLNEDPGFGFDINWDYVKRYRA
jgi:L-alanine-DL-glutamate epimerase-like enolase superfamily enzyme